MAQATTMQQWQRASACKGFCRKMRLQWLPILQAKTEEDIGAGAGLYLLYRDVRTLSGSERGSELGSVVLIFSFFCSTFAPLKSWSIGRLEITPLFLDDGSCIFFRVPKIGGTRLYKLYGWM